MADNREKGHSLTNRVSELNVRGPKGARLGASRLLQGALWGSCFTLFPILG